MRVGLLGTLEVVDDAGRRIVLAGPRQRVLLAVLAVHANEPMPPDVLAEALWDGAPPPGYGATLRTHVKRLRRALGPRAARIVTRDPGYLIELGATELDVTEFESACREAHTALRAEETEQAAHAARRALKMWRGEPLADVASRALRDACLPRFEQLQVQVLEDGIEAQLRLGRHEQVLEQVRGLTARYPLRERFHAQLMLALVRTGRRAEALSAYQDARRVLVEELGIEPGPELRALQQQTLAGHEPTAGAHPEPATRSAPPGAVPHQLPAPARHFTGRVDELEAVINAATQAHPAGGAVVICAIDGMGGIGKSALALHAARLLAERYPDGQLFIDLHGYTKGVAVREPDDALAVILQTLGIPPQQMPAGLDARAALYRDRLADTRTLILLDNARDGEQVRPLLPGGGRSLVLVTSRTRLRSLDDAYSVSLGPLPAADAIRLLRAVAGPEHRTVDDAVFEQVAHLCGRLPLALRIAAALLRHRRAWSAAHLADKLRESRPGLGLFRDGERDLAAVFELSYRTLTNDQRLLLRRLALAAGPDADAYAAAALLQIDPPHAERSLQDLVDHNLLAEPAAGRYRMHELTRLYAQGLAEPHPAQQAVAVDRLLDYYQHSAARADARIAPFIRPEPTGPAPTHGPSLHDAQQAYAWLRAERANLEAWIQRAAAEAQAARTIALTAGLATLLREDGPLPQAAALHTAAAAAAEGLSDTPAQAAALTQLGAVYGMSNDYAGALRVFDQAIALHNASGDRSGRAAALAERAVVRRVAGEPVGAAQDLEQALETFRELGDPLSQANVLTLLGIARYLTGDSRRAIQDLEESLRLHRSLQDRRGQATAMGFLGGVQHANGDLPAAMENLELALELYRELDNRAGQARSLIEMSAVHRQNGDLEDAMQAADHGSRLYRRLGDRLGEAIASYSQAVISKRVGDLDAAMRGFEHALELFRQIGARSNLAWTLNGYAAVVRDAGDPARAATLFRDALVLARETLIQDEQAIALEGLGECYLAAGEPREGAEYLTQALAIYRQLAQPLNADRVNARLAALDQA